MFPFPYFPSILNCFNLTAFIPSVSLAVALSSKAVLFSSFSTGLHEASGLASECGRDTGEMGEVSFQLHSMTEQFRLFKTEIMKSNSLEAIC